MIVILQCSYNLIYLDGQSVTCHHTDGSTETTCEVEVGPSTDGYCFLDCILDHSDNRYTCSQDCIFSTFGHCRTNITTRDFVSYCCQSSYCNNSTVVLSSILANIDFPSPTGKQLLTYSTTNLCHTHFSHFSCTDRRHSRWEQL